VARCYPTVRRGYRWIVAPPIKERGRVTVLALLNETNSSVRQIRVFRRMPMRRRAIHVGENNQWLNTGSPLQQMASLVTVTHEVRARTIEDRK